MYLMYIDESGNTGTDYKNKEQPILTMSGVIVKDTNWLEINNELSELKRELFGKSDIEIHAALMYNPKHNPKKEAERFWRERDWRENIEALDKIVDFMIASELTLMSINLNKKQLKDYSNSDIDPYYLGLICLSYCFDIFLGTNNDKGGIITDKISSIDENLTQDILNILRISDEYKIHNIIERPLKTDSRLSNFVQLADVAAFCRNKYITWDGVNADERLKLSRKEKEICRMDDKLYDSIYYLGELPRRDIILSEFKKLLNIIK